MKNRIVDIVVTYNRKTLLAENIAALLNQTFRDHDIMIIDNGSTDGTNELVQSYNDKRIIYYNTGKNLGGAGGFSIGIKKAILSDYDYAWIMDDDSIPNPDALATIVNKMEYIDWDFSFISSLVYWIDGKIFPMNCPSINVKKVEDANYDLIRRAKLLSINRGSFVGCFVNLKIAKKIALPISDFFIYGDDLEYTGRLRNEAKAYLNLDSIIVHKAPSNKGADIVTAEEDRIGRFYFQFRNGMYIARKENKILKRLIMVTRTIGKVLLKSKNNRFKRIRMVLFGTASGVFYNPQLEFVH